MHYFFLSYRLISTNIFQNYFCERRDIENNQWIDPNPLKRLKEHLEGVLKVTLPRRSSSIKRPFATHAARKGRAVVTAVPTPKTQVHDTTLFLVLAFAPRRFSILQNACSLS